jgi:hypothetical protein
MAKGRGHRRGDQCGRRARRRVRRRALATRARSPLAAPSGKPFSDEITRISPGINRPPTRPVRESQLNDDDTVIGVIADGKARAYKLEALVGREDHVVNDLIDGVPVSITYCNIAQCVRGFSGPVATTPLDVGLGGLKGNRMIITVKGVPYYQDTGKSVDEKISPAPFPYPSFPTTRTTWREWKEAHADSDVYEGVANRERD